MEDYFLLAVKNLKHRGVRSWLTLLGIFIGIAAVVSLISLGSALKAAVSSQFGVSSTEVIAIRAGGVSGAGPPGTGVTEPLTTKDVEAIEKISSIEYAFGRIISTQKQEYNNRANFGIVFSLPDGKKREFAYEALGFEIEEGRLLKDGDTNKVVIGYNLFAGKESFQKPITVGKKIVIGGKKFEVVGAIKKKGSFIWDNAIMMNEKELRELADYGDKVDIIIAKAKNKDLVEKASEEIEKVMRKRRNVEKGKENFEVSTPQGSLETVNNILGGVSAFVIIIASISILVGAVGIVNTMTTSVIERKKDIGIMKAIGAKNTQIFLQFFIESGMLGLTGGAFGILAGLLIGAAGTSAINNFIGGSISPNFDVFLIVAALFGSFVVGSISGIIPAINASRQNPVEALRS